MVIWELGFSLEKLRVFVGWILVWMGVTVLGDFDVTMGAKQRKVKKKNKNKFLVDTNPEI